jgi:hypothetical protein
VWKITIFPSKNKSLLASFSSEKEESFFLGDGGEGSAEAEAYIGFWRWGPQRRGAAFGPVIEASGASSLLQTHNSVLGPKSRLQSCHGQWCCSFLDRRAHEAKAWSVVKESERSQHRGAKESEESISISQLALL